VPFALEFDYSMLQMSARQVIFHKLSKGILAQPVYCQPVLFCVPGKMHFQGLSGIWPSIWQFSREGILPSTVALIITGGAHGNFDLEYVSSLSSERQGAGIARISSYSGSYGTKNAAPGLSDQPDFLQI